MEVAVLPIGAIVSQYAFEECAKLVHLSLSQQLIVAHSHPHRQDFLARVDLSNTGIHSCDLAAELRVCGV